MKIIYCTPAIYNSAGTERVLSMKANYLVREVGYDVTIITTDQQGRSNYFDFDSRIKHIDLGLNYSEDINRNIFMQVLTHNRKNIIYKKRLAKILQEENPDICVSLMGKEIEFLTDIHHPCKKIVEMHFCHDYKYMIKTSNHKGLIWKIAGRYLTYQLVALTKKFDKLVVLTREDQKDWEKTNSNVAQIYNSLPYESEVVSTLESKSMIAVGRLSYEKNYEEMVRVWTIVSQRHPDWKLNIWGGGELKDIIQARIDEAGLTKNVILRGQTNNISQEYLNNSAYIMTSRHEGFPMVLLEASSSGLPLIAYACKCGPSDIINDGQNGFLLNQGDTYAMAEAICKIIEDAQLRKYMGRTSKIRSEEFSQENILPQWPKFFEEIVKQL